MRIRCVDVDAFIENLKQRDVYNKTVFMEKLEEPLNGDRRDATSWMIYMQATTVLDFPDGGQSLLECQQECGIDRESENEFEGTDFFKRLREQIEVYCDEYGLMVKPGVVDF